MVCSKKFLAWAMVIRGNTKSSFEEEKPVFELIEGVTFWIQDYWSKEAVVRVGFPDRTKDLGVEFDFRDSAY